MWEREAFRHGEERGLHTFRSSDSLILELGILRSLYSHLLSSLDLRYAQVKRHADGQPTRLGAREQAVANLRFPDSLNPRSLDCGCSKRLL
jgi:hypothetical protein